jgi:hypothetical protein
MISFAENFVVGLLYIYNRDYSPHFKIISANNAAKVLFFSAKPLKDKLLHG